MHRMDARPTRRTMLMLGGVGLLAFATVHSGLAEESEKPFDAGNVKDFGQGIADTFAPNWPHLFVIREGDKLWVATSLCTHKRCDLRRTGAGFSCECHRCKFRPDGVPIRGPAVKPLPRYGVTIDDRGHVMVDLSKVFEQDRWDEAGAFVKVS